MDLSLSSLEKVVLVKLSSAELKKLLVEISKKFTTNRKEIDDYTQDRQRVSAYTYFYLPTNIPKYAFIIDQLPSAVREKLGDSTFIDFGSGPGTFGLAHMNYFPQCSRMSLVDSSQIMLEQSRGLLEFYFPLKKAKYSTTIEDCDFLNSENITLFFGHSINEIGAAKVMKIVKSIKPRFVFFIEPGTPSVFKEVLLLRDELYKENYLSHYPCPSTSLNCPLKEGNNDWCHQVFKTTHDPSVERLSQIIGKDRRSMPLIAHFYERGEQATIEKKLESEVFITRLLGETKFSFEMEACAVVASKNTQIKIEVMKKNLKSKEIKELRKMSSGVKIDFELKKVLIDGTQRGYIKMSKGQ